MYRCPVCAARLLADERVYRCPVGHSFDVAREGYVNLLAGRSARTRVGGDDESMVRARRAFLDRGHYEPLRTALLGFIDEGDVLDVGCGEGFYTRPLPGRLKGWLGGIDISKIAIRLAARRCPAIRYAVANAFDLPVESQSVDTVVSVFGPLVPDEFRRVLRSDGRALVVAPGPRHLVELKRQLFADATQHELRAPKSLEGELPLAQVERVTFEISVEQPYLDALAAMTPYKWQAPTETFLRLAELPRLDVTADFLLCVYDRD